MNQSANPSLRELKRETEQTRAGLTQTVEQLRTSVSETASEIRQRISPEAIKAEVSDYARSRAERLIEDITSAARRNPMQAVAVGASIAYPLLRLARHSVASAYGRCRSFFPGSKAGQSATEKASDIASDLSDEVRRRSHDLSDQVGASITAAKDLAADAAVRAGAVMSTGTDQMRRSTASASSELQAGTDSMRDKLVSVGDAVSSRTRDIKDGVCGLCEFGDRQGPGSDIGRDDGSPERRDLDNECRARSSQGPSGQSGGRVALGGQDGV
jgi:hypothetical protein